MTTVSREQRKQQTRQKILDAATRTFAEVGFDAASLADIASLCAVKKALVQYHFETKDKLWKASIAHLWGQLRASLPNYLASLPASESALVDVPEAEKSESIRQVLRQIIRFARDHPAWVATMFREASQPGPRLDWLVENYLQQDFADGTRFVELAQQQGLLPQTPPLHLLLIISGALTYALQVAPLTERVTGIDMNTEQSLDTLVDTLMIMLSSQQE